MREIRDLLRCEPRARVFFATLTQSSLGNGAGYVALLIVALARFDSPWAISLVLIADLVPSMVLGPVFGAAADRWSRRTCTVVADLVRAVAFVGIAVVDSFEATVALALLAGAGTGLFTPAALAGLPSLVDRSRLPAATSLYGAIADVGYTVGPAVAGGVLLVGSAESLLLANGITFLASALALSRLDFGAQVRSEAGPEQGRRSLLAETREGLRAVAGLRGIRTVLIASAAALFFAGLFNVSELLFATRDLGTSNSGYSVLVALFGVGFVLGSLSGSGGGTLEQLKRHYLVGLLLMGIGLISSGAAPTFAVAVVAFGVGGFGNGVVLVNERLLIQGVVPDGLAGRIFGVKDTLTAWAFGVAFVCAGGLIALIGTRALLVAAGAGALAAFAASALALRGLWEGPRGGSPTIPAQESMAGPSTLGSGADASGHRSVGKHSSDSVDG